MTERETIDDTEMLDGWIDFASRIQKQGEER